MLADSPVTFTRFRARAALDHAARVRRRRPPAVQALEDDVDLQDAIGLSLLVAIQEATDIRRIWAELPAGLAAVERYATAIARFIPPPAR